jgi:hypothetical protein
LCIFCLLNAPVCGPCDSWVWRRLWGPAVNVFVEGVWEGGLRRRRRKGAREKKERLLTCLVQTASGSTSHALWNPLSWQSSGSRVLASADNMAYMSSCVVWRDEEKTAPFSCRWVLSWKGARPLLGSPPVPCLPAFFSSVLAMWMGQWSAHLMKMVLYKPSTCDNS